MTRRLLAALALGGLVVGGLTCKNDPTPPTNPVIVLSPASRSFSATQGGASPAAQTVAITNGGDGTLSGLSSSITYAAGQATGWLSAGLSGTAAPSTLTLTATTGALAAGTYSAVVSVATADASNSPQPVLVTFTLAAAVPAAPSNLTATPTSASQIALSWTDNATNEDGFRIERCTGAGCASFVEIATVGPNVAAYQNTGLSANTAYGYRVRAYNTVGPSAYSNTASATTSDTPPAAPTLLSGAAGSSTSITIYWVDNSTNETGFRIERCAGPACSSFAEIATVGAGANVYQNTGLTASTSYTYRVRAYNGAGASSYSNTATIVTFDVSVAPAAPSNLVAVGVSGAINLSWTDNSSNENGFLIERAPFGTTLYSQIVTIGANSTSYQDPGLPAGISYSYRLRAYNGTGASPYSNTADATTPVPPPAAPSNLGATAISASQINLAWTDNATTETGFNIERCTGAGCNAFAVLATVGANVTTYQNTGLAAGTTYGYRVRAANAGGVSTYSNTASATTLAPPLAAPSNLGATAISTSQINLAWTDNATNETGFNIERCTGAGCNTFAVLATVGANVTTYQNTGLVAGTTYGYRVRAANASGTSAYSNTASATTLAPPLAAPSNLGATAISTSQINLAWTDNATNETGFEIERCVGAGCSSFAALATVGANVTTYQNTGLAAGTTYGYRVRAANASGTSPYSNTASATTQQTLVAPSLAVPLVNGADVTLTWTYTWQGLVSSNDGYRLEQSTSPTSGFVEVFSVASTQSPYSTTRTNLASGTYYYRVRALTQQGFTPYSVVRSATVSGSTSTTLRVINDLPGIVVGSNDWGKLNTIIRVRVGPTANSVIFLTGGARELLYPLDFTSDVANTIDIAPGTEMTLNVAGYTTEYWLYIQTGYWEYFPPSSTWEKHMAVVAACDGVSSAYKWTTIRIFPPFGNPEVIRASNFLPPGNWYGSTYCP